MTTRLTWSEVDARWPGASAHWDSVPGRFDPVLTSAGETLYAVGPGCPHATGAAVVMYGACNCLVWTGARWIERSDLHEPRMRELCDEVRARGALTQWHVPDATIRGAVDRCLAEAHEIIRSYGTWPMRAHMVAQRSGVGIMTVEETLAVLGALASLDAMMMRPDDMRLRQEIDRCRDLMRGLQPYQLVPLDPPHRPAERRDDGDGRDE